MYIGIDIGTTGLKGILCDDVGNILSSHYTEYPLIFNGGHIEQDAACWWNAAKAAVISVTKQAKTKDITAISVSAQGISFVPVDKNGNTLSNAISWLDKRALNQSNSLAGKFGADKIYEKTGKPMSSGYTLSKLMWFKENLPDMYEKTHQFLMPLDYINFKLCKRAVTDYTMASGTMAYNICKPEWDGELLEFAKIDKKKLPDVLPMGNVIGTVCPSVAKEMGISSEVAVVLGGQDQKLAALGAGIDKKSCAVSFGTATAISKIQNSFSPSHFRYPVFRLNKSDYMAESSIGTTGAAVKWLRDTIFSGLPYSEMDKAAAASPKGANGISFSCNFVSGAEMSGLTLSTSKGDITRALYEDICNEIKEKIDCMGGAERLLAYGGGAKSDIWCGILSDTTKLKVYRPKTVETAALGAVMLASQGKVPCAKIEERMI